MSLYDKDCRYTEAAFSLDEKTHNALEKIFADSVKDGASPREVAHIMISVIHGLELFHVL
tara:strand:+ start:119 stop:298 length:180 start_codon:yes stop_codon:yes gene_type:complete